MILSLCILLKSNCHDSLLEILEKRRLKILHIPDTHRSKRQTLSDDGDGEFYANSAIKLIIVHCSEPGLQRGGDGGEAQHPRPLRRAPVLPDRGQELRDQGPAEDGDRAQDPVRGQRRGPVRPHQGGRWQLQPRDCGPGKYSILIGQ